MSTEPPSPADATNNETPKLIKGKCDICLKNDGYGGHNLQKCKECGLLVHELCYATAPTDRKDPNFVCHACNAVGTEIEVNVPSKVGGSGGDTGKHREFMRQESRPVECVLCSVKTGMHSMHPIYDRSGKEGRQLVLPASGVGFKKTEKRLAWVHSLCAQFICLKTGCVFGCFEEGKFEETNRNREVINDGNQNEYDAADERYPLGMEVSKTFTAGEFSGKVVEYHPEERLYTVLYEDGDQEDLTREELEDILVGEGPPKKKTRVSTRNSDDAESSDDKHELVGTDWFCFDVESKNNGLPSKNLTRIRELRSLRCIICKTNDTRALRIPVQCCAWDRDEFKEFRKCHNKNTPKMDRLCTKAIHVGCARWGSDTYAAHNGRKMRMCYYYPGQKAGYDGKDVKYHDPVSDCFCNTHAHEVMDNLRKDRGDIDSDEEVPDPIETYIMKKKERIEAKKKRNAFLVDSDDEEIE